MIKRVAQRYPDNGDCGLACVAMIAGVTYEDAFCAFRRLEGKSRTKRFYTNHQQVEQMLCFLGFETRRIKFHSWEIKCNAIVKVNCDRNNPRYWHWVVFDAEQNGVHDPNPKKTKMVTEADDLNNLNGCGNYITIY